MRSSALIMSIWSLFLAENDDCAFIERGGIDILLALSSFCTYIVELLNFHIIL